MSTEIAQRKTDNLLNTDKSEYNTELSVEEIDALGEIGNICMGAAATTLSKILRNEVLIDTPKVSITDKSDLENNHPSSYISVAILYTKGLQGENLLNIKEDDAKIMVDLMLGGEGKIEEGPITDMHLDALGEAMNQMMGSSATAMAQMFDTVIEISPPTPIYVNHIEPKSIEILNEKFNSKLVKVVFNLSIGVLLKSEIGLIMNLTFAKEIVHKLFDSNAKISKQAEKDECEGKVDIRDETRKEENAVNGVNSKKDIKNVKYQDFKQNQIFETAEGSPINLLLDVPLQVTVELGKTKKSIKEILDFNIGTIIELNKVAGDPVDIVIGGKIVGRGEVVVIDETFGVRVTEVMRNE